jgi:cold shock protein
VLAGAVAPIMAAAVIILLGHVVVSPVFGRRTYNWVTDPLYDRCYQSQIDGLWRFAAPFSFYRTLSNRSADWRPPPIEGNGSMPTGTVKFFNTDKGYGFIQPDDGGSDAFVHISAVEKAGMRTLNKEQRVTYDLEEGQRGRTSAINLQAAE